MRKCALEFLSHDGLELKTLLMRLILKIWVDKIVSEEFKCQNIHSLKERDRSLYGNYHSISILNFADKNFAGILMAGPTP